MTTRSSWNALTARIDGFLRSWELHLRALAINSEDPYSGATGGLLPEASNILADIKAFKERFGGSLPPAAVEALDSFLGEQSSHFQRGTGSEFAVARMKRIAPALGSLRFEISFHLADHAASARRLTERAFIHLQRSIIVDDSVQEKWQCAFGSGETACERLGAVHLLAHGIWAFKGYSPGERTDLILNEVVDLALVESTAEALVLTEWKRVSEPSKVQEVADRARRQAARYSSGSLAGLELISVRYVVLVSERHLKELPQDFQNDTVTYRHINVAVNPESPSRS